MRSKLVLMVILPVLLLYACKENDPKKSEKDIDISISDSINIPQKLMDIPRMLVIINEPNAVKAIRDPKDSSIYIWKFKTSIRSKEGDIKIIEFGDYVKKDSGMWELHNYTDNPFTTKEFSEWYFESKNGEFSWNNPKDGIVKDGIEYVDPSNWTERSDSLHEQEGMWYFIGVRDDGTKVCGYDYYNNLPELSKR